MKYLLTFIILFILSLSVQAVTFERYYSDEPIPEQGVKLRAGTMLRVMSLRNINTFANDIGDECEFLNVTDMFVEDVLVIPKNARVYGMIEDIREPVQGNNAAIKIKINKIFFPDDEKTFYIEGHVSGGRDFYIGGEATNSAYYRKVPHYTQGWHGGILQLAPLNIYGYGEHKVINAGEELIIFLEKDLIIF